jgi:glycosyltransferase involved in cell wall biosynthesis
MSRNLLVANNRFFPSGGPERYLFNLLPALPRIGWQGVPFALRLDANQDNEYGSDFASPPAGEDYVLFSDRALTLREKVRVARKVIYDPAARTAARTAIRKRSCAAVYGLQIAHYLYPEVVLAAADCNVPVVLRLSDFQLICPAYSMYREGAPCELCRNGLFNSIRHRCMKGSIAASTVRYMAMRFARNLRVTDLVARFVCPSKFLAEKLAAFGFDSERLVHVPTPIPDELEKQEPTPPPINGPTLFVGGLYEPKGAQVAVRAALKHGFELVVAGAVETPLGRVLQDEVKQAGVSNVKFAGFAKGEQLARLYREASCVVIPSLWYENSPNVALEAMAHGRPVIASDLGSLPETVEQDKAGLLFSAGDPDALAECVETLRGDTALAASLGGGGRKKVLAEHTMDQHIAALKKLFAGLV